MNDTFMLHLFLLSAKSCDAIIVALVKVGIEVKSGFASGEIPQDNENRPCVCLCLQLRYKEPIAMADMSTIVRKIVDDVGVHIFGIVLTVGLVASMTSHSNIIIPKEDGKPYTRLLFEPQKDNKTHTPEEAARKEAEKLAKKEEEKKKEEKFKIN
jgi:hypothetical protein